MDCSDVIVGKTIRRDIIRDIGENWSISGCRASALCDIGECVLLAAEAAAAHFIRHLLTSHPLFRITR